MKEIKTRSQDIKIPISLAILSKGKIRSRETIYCMQLSSWKKLSYLANRGEKLFMKAPISKTISVLGAILNRRTTKVRIEIQCILVIMGATTIRTTISSCFSR